MLLLVSGCAATGKEESSTAQSEPAVEAQEAPSAEAPLEEQAKGKKDSKKNSKKNHSSQKGSKNEAAIREELNAAASKLVMRASRTITPSKSNKSVTKSSNGYVAKYISIDPQNYSTDMRPGVNPGRYVGFVRYSEQIYQCVGKTKKEALSAPCTAISSRRVNEMIRYDGSQWHY